MKESSSLRTVHAVIRHVYMSCLNSLSHMHAFLKTAKQFEGLSSLGTYGDALEELDWSVSAILEVLEGEGVSNNTLVLFTTDNGGHIELGNEGGSNAFLKSNNKLKLHVNNKNKYFVMSSYFPVIY